MTAPAFRLENVSSAAARSGRPYGTFHKHVLAGRLPRPVKIGKRSVIPSHELDAVLAAEAAGQDADSIRALVRRLFDERAAMAAKLAALEPTEPATPMPAKSKGPKQREQRA